MPDEADKLAAELGITRLQAERQIRDRRELLRRPDVRRQGYRHLLK